jgi:hypothetical protein
MNVVLGRVSGPVSIVLHKLCSVLALLKELLSVAKILDSTLLQLIKTMLETFGVDNIQLLQLKAIGVVCMVHPIPLFLLLSVNGWIAICIVSMAISKIARQGTLLIWRNPLMNLEL